MHHLTLQFPFRLPPYLLSAFRGAINELVDPAAEVFHNHNNGAGPSAYHWDYPRIRYSLFRGRATVTGLGEGALAIMQHLLPALLEYPQLYINGTPYPVARFQCHQQELNLELADQPQPFGLHRWVALNKDNYRQWKQLESKEDARKILLGRALTGHLRTLAETLAPELDRQEIVAEVLRVDQQKRIRWHGTTLVGFNVVAESRLLSPLGLGLGRLVAFGFGEILPPRVYRQLLEVRNNSELATIEQMR